MTDSELIVQEINYIKSTVASLAEGVKNLAVDLRGFSMMNQAIITRLDDRDKQLQDSTSISRDSFTRIDTRVTKLEDNVDTRLDIVCARISKVEVATAKIPIIEKMIYGVLGGVGTLIVLYIQKKMGV